MQAKCITIHPEERTRIEETVARDGKVHDYNYKQELLATSKNYSLESEYPLSEAGD